MKKLSIEQKQLVYEFLLEKGVPDLYAALIAERQVKYMDNCTVLKYVGANFAWLNTPESRDFWSALDDELFANLPEYSKNKVDIVLEDEPEDVKSSAGEDFIAIGTNFNSDKEVETIRDNEVFGYVYNEEPELTFWQKIKFYAGRLFFKV